MAAVSPALGSRALRSLLAAAAPLPHQVPTSRCSRRSLLPLFRIAQLPARREASPSCPANHPPTGPPPTPHLARQLPCPPLPWAWEALFGSLPRPFPKIWSRLTNKSPPQSPCAPSSVRGPQSPHPHPYPYLSTPIHLLFILQEFALSFPLVILELFFIYRKLSFLSFKGI